MRRAGKKNPESLVRFYLVVAVLCTMLTLLVSRVLSLQIIDTERGYEFLQDQGDMRSRRFFAVSYLAIGIGSTDVEITQYRIT